MTWKFLVLWYGIEETWLGWILNPRETTYLWRNEKQQVINLPHIILVLCSISEAGDYDAAAAGAASPPAEYDEMVLVAFAAWA